MDPYDGWYYNTAALAEFNAGNTSIMTDKLINMQNQVVQILRDHFNDGKTRRIGTLAYYYHSPPPSIAVDPDIIIQPTQGFITGGFTFDEIMAGWRAKAPGNIFLTYGYGNYYTGGACQPYGTSGSSYPQSFADKIAELDINYDFSTYLLESGFTPADNLGHYIAAQVWWDVEKANDVDDMLDEFYATAFAGVETPIRRFFELTQGESPVQFGYNRIGEMYRVLDEAYGIATEPNTVARIEDLIKYSRYAELRLDWNAFLATNPSDLAKEIGTTSLMKYMYRMNDAVMASTRMAMIYALGGNHMGMIAVEGAGEIYRFDQNIDPHLHPWYDDTPFTPTELQGYMTDGITNYSIPFSTEPNVYSTNLVSADSLGLVRPPAFPGHSNDNYAPNKREYIWLAESAAESFDFEVMTGDPGTGYYSAYGPTIVSLYHMDPNTGEKTGSLLSSQTAPWDGVWYDVPLTADGVGLYIIELDTQIPDAKAIIAGGSTAIWPSTVKITQRWDEENMPLVGYVREMFFVPTGTTVINAVQHPSGSGGGLYDADGNFVFYLNDQLTYFQIAVPAGMDGKLWGIVGGPPFRLLNVPPYWAQRVNQLILPAEVVAGE